MFLLAATVYRSQPKLDIRHFCECEVIDSGAAGLPLGALQGELPDCGSPSHGSPEGVSR